MKRVLKYTAAMCTAVAFDYGFYSIFYLLWHWGLIFSNVSSFILGTFIAVYLIRKFVFTNPKYSLFKDLMLTLGSNGSVYLFGLLIIVVLVDYFEVNHYVAKTIGMSVTFVINFFVRKYILSKQDHVKA